MSEVHPQMQESMDAFAQMLKSAGLPDLRGDDVAATRAFLDSLAPPEESLPPIHRVEARTIPGPENAIPLRIYRPSEARNLPALMWFHGGGWVFGTLEGQERTCRKLAHEVGCVVVSVDYRLAPETPFPGAIDDCSAATTWVAESSAELGIDPTRIAVAGISAGGNLAACVAYRARTRGPQLAFQLLIVPVIDADFDRPSHLENAGSSDVTRADAMWHWDRYVPNPADRTRPDVSPIHAPDLSGLPPALIITAEFDPLRDEGEAYAAALQAAGVAVVTRRYAGMIHGFFNMVTAEPVDEIAAAWQEAVAALRRAFGTS